MAKKARQRISYVLENAKASAGGHRLGVNGLAVDSNNGILYSGGRDGIVCAWDLNFASTSPDNAKSKTTFRAQTQAHMHWINDIALAKNNTALVSASSDLTVKLWRPHSEEDSLRAQTIGEHADYVKCVAPPPADMNLDWIASGGLDRKICLWDLNGRGKTLEIDVKGEDVPEKGSVYALSCGRNMIASGGPERLIRLYDPRTGSRISKLVGHVDNIRAILLDDAGDTVLSASSDKTIKLWSIKGGRCMYTYTMHDDSVWSLFSDDPSLGVFYSSDRSGMVAKTDVRGSLEDLDDGLSVALVQEHFGVSKVVAAGGNIWTATNHSSINRWQDIDTGAGVQLPEAYRNHRAFSIASNRPPQPSLSRIDTTKQKEVPVQSILRVSTMALFPPRNPIEPEATSPGETVPQKGLEVGVEHPAEIRPFHQLPEETIEGQFGLLKHKLLNDRRRVLTLDTAGDVLLWDLIKCKPIQSFGKQHLEDVETVVNTQEAVAPWCSVDLSSGNLTVVLEPYNCFDAEVYVDELEFEEPVEFREDQRISLGRWILRYLFANLIDEEIKRDEVHRQALNEEVEKRSGPSRANAPSSIVLPTTMPTWESMDQVTTPRPNGSQYPATTPGFGIGLATPAPALTLQTGVAVSSPMSGGDKGRMSTERDDYFAGGIASSDGGAKSTGAPVTPAATETSDTKNSGDNGTDKGKDKEKTTDSAKSPTSAFGKKFRMSFSTKKLARSGSQATQEKPAVVDEKAEESESSSSHEKEVDDSFFGVIQKIRNEYEKQLLETPNKLVETRVTPSLPSETPVLKLPAATQIIIQEETSGGSANIYQGTVASVGKDAHIIEQKAPMWLGDVLLQNQIPFKEPVKISFVLHPLGDLPIITAEDGNNRLNANRMLRVKKILAYVAERIEPQPEEPDPNALRPEEYLELYCNDKLLSNTMTLATLRTHVWKGGSDIVLHYKSNGKKVIQPLEPPVKIEEEASTGDDEAAPPATGAAVASNIAATSAATTTTAA